MTPAAGGIGVPGPVGFPISGEVEACRGFLAVTSFRATGRGVLYVRFMGEDAVVPLRRRVG